MLIKKENPYNLKVIRVSLCLNKVYPEIHGLYTQMMHINDDGENIGYPEIQALHTRCSTQTLYTVF